MDETNKNPPMEKINLEKFIKDCQHRLTRILQRLEWTKDDVLKDFNTNSKTTQIKEPPIEAHVRRGTPLPESYTTKNSIVIAPHELQDLLGDPHVQVPQTFQDLQANFSREQKLKIYEYVLQNTDKTTEVDLTQTALREGEPTFAEIVDAKKREKRKKRKYRISKPTLIEEVRSLVELQMQALQQYLGNKEPEREEKCRLDSSRELNQLDFQKNKEEESKTSGRKGRWEFSKTHERSSNTSYEGRSHTKGTFGFNKVFHRARSRDHGKLDLYYNERNRSNWSRREERTESYKRDSRSKSGERVRTDGSDPRHQRRKEEKRYRRNSRSKSREKVKNHDSHQLSKSQDIQGGHREERSPSYNETRKKHKRKRSHSRSKFHHEEVYTETKRKRKRRSRSYEEKSSPNKIKNKKHKKKSKKEHKRSKVERKHDYE